MDWKYHYLPPVQNRWQGRPDLPEASCFFQIVKMLDLREINIKQTPNTFAIIGFCCDEGIRRNFGRPGASEAPAIIREFFAKMPVQKHSITLYDAGDINCIDGDLEAAQKSLADCIHILLAQQIVPIVLGGGHEVAWANYQGIVATYPKAQLGIVNFDAHLDMRPMQAKNMGTSGTPFLQIAEHQQKHHHRLDYNCFGVQPTGNTRALFETAKQFQVQILFAEDVQQNIADKCNHFIERAIQQNQIIYLSLCLDVFAAAFAPGVSAPQSFGLAPWHLLPYIRQLAESGKVVLYDVAELSPPLDIDHRTAKLAAHLIYEIIHHHISLLPV